MKILANTPGSIVDMYERQITRRMTEKTRHMAENEFTRILDREKQIY